MIHRIGIWLMGCVLLVQFCQAQDLPSDSKQQLENLAEITESDIEDDTYLQQLQYVKEHPLDINKADKEEWQVFPFLSDLHIDHLLRYRNLLGPFISLYELQSVPGWDLSLIRKLLPFITIGSMELKKESLVKRLFEGEHQILMRGSRTLEPSKGFTTSLSNHFTGDRNHWLARYRYQYKNLLQYGVTAEKDPGEPFFNKANKSGFDFYSFHLFARHIGVVKHIAIGDYSVNLGQGLIQWQSLAFKKSAEVINIKRQSAALRPYSSAGEFYFNRGFGVTIATGKLETTLFGSVRNLSANTAFDTLYDRPVFTSFLYSGLHRTRSEIQDRKSIRQQSFGGNISIRNKLWKLGINAVRHQFSAPFQKRNEPYNLFAWSGTNWYNISLDYSITIKNKHFFGEAALDKRGQKAFLQGALISLDPRVDISLLHRVIGKGYQSVYGNAFTENTLPVNESGFYGGISIKPVSGLQINLYADIYSSPWIKYRTDAPSSGKDFLVQLSYQPNRTTEVYTRFRSEFKQMNESQNLFPVNYIRAKPRQNWRLHYAQQVSPRLTFRSRVEMVWYDRKGGWQEEGFLIYSEAHYKAQKAVSANIRLQYFETGGYSSRIYAYEHDVLYAYSIPAFFDQGFRYYLNISYDRGKNLSFWFRLAQTLYQGKDRIGSGLNEIEGNKRSEFKMQALIKL